MRRGSSRSDLARPVLIGSVIVVTLMWLMFSSPSASQEKVYGLVIDAGSTGSRIHAYRFREAEGSLVLETELFEQLEPGLSSHAADPVHAASTLRPLLDSAVKFIPRSQRKTTPIVVRATAGLRLLPGDQAEAILNAVSDLLHKEYPFQLKSDGVGIMDGSDEGLYSWVTINYLLNKERETIAVLDLGGSSTQISVEAVGSAVATLPASQLESLDYAGAQRRVFTHSHLGYGLMAARAATFSSSSSSSGSESVCVAPGSQITYAFKEKKFALTGAADASFAKCQGAVEEALFAGKTCTGSSSSVAVRCAIGILSPAPASNDVFYAISYYFDRARDANLIPVSATHGTVTPLMFKTAALDACSLASPQLHKTFPHATKDGPPMLCSDLTYIYTLLVRGFGLADSTQIHLGKKIDYRGEVFEAAWSLGAVLPLVH